MTLNAYLTLDGSRQGAISGDVHVVGRENSILVYAAAHAILRPVDAITGLPTGNRQHKPFVITKEIDKASPLMYKALITNEDIVTWRLEFWRMSPTGIEQPYYVVNLLGSSIVSVDFSYPGNMAPDLAKGSRHEVWTFSYRKIEWTWVDDTIIAADDWLAPVQPKERVWIPWNVRPHAGRSHIRRGSKPKDIGR
jgi:type VI secretion system secreted protein Hcp